MTTFSRVITATLVGSDSTGVAVEKRAATAPMVTTESRLAKTAVTAVSVRERMLKVRFMRGSKVF